MICQNAIQPACPNLPQTSAGKSVCGAKSLILFAQTSCRNLALQTCANCCKLEVLLSANFRSLACCKLRPYGGSVRLRRAQRCPLPTVGFWGAEIPYGLVWQERAA